MNERTYSIIESYMLHCMEDSAHDKEHVYRVLYNALEIAKTEQNVDLDVLIGACLLHDIGRKEQFENPELCHAQVGSEKAYDFLIKNGFEKSFAENIRHCVMTHRYREANQPQTIEAKILFDADKLDVTGAIGIARTLIYNGTVSEPIYSLSSNGDVSDGSSDEPPSFFHEYKFKLERIYSRFYTAEGKRMAEKRRQTAVDFYDSLFSEVNDSYRNGQDILKEVITSA